MKAARYDPACDRNRQRGADKTPIENRLLLMDQKFYVPLRSFFQAVKSSDEQQVVLETGGAAAGN